MYITLHRRKSGVKATIGMLYVDGIFECYTLEDVVREVDGEPVEKWKIPGETAIPAGKYPVIVDHSAHFQKQLPHVLQVPGFDGVRIHPGNTDKDTEGCILVGTTVAGEDFISASVAAFEPLFAKIEASLAGNRQVELEIRNVGSY